MEADVQKKVDSRRKLREQILIPFPLPNSYLAILSHRES